jgi:hypothetical protein
MEDNRHDELDSLIDGALVSYSDAEPLAGMERRILNRIRATEAARRRMARWWRWAIAIPALASLVALAAVMRWGRVQPVPKTETARAEAAPPPARIEPLAAPAGRIPPPRAQPRRLLPKQERFPTPSPLTPEERALIALAQTHPEALQFQTVERIEIPPIAIPPLRIDGGQ